MKFVPGDRVVVEAGDVVDPFVGWWSGRSATVGRQVADEARVLWDDSKTIDVVPVRILRHEGAHRFCPVCHKHVFLATGAASGERVELVPERDGPLVIVAGVGVGHYRTEALKLIEERRREGVETTRMTMHWRVCPNASKRAV